MDGQKPKRLKINETIVAALERALRSAKRDGCGVDKDAQEAMRIYLDSWCVAPLEDALACIRGEKDTWEIDYWLGS